MERKLLGVKCASLLIIKPHAENCSIAKHYVQFFLNTRNKFVIFSQPEVDLRGLWAARWFWPPPECSKKVSLCIILSEDMDTAIALVSRESVQSVQNNQLFFFSHRVSEARHSGKMFQSPHRAVKRPLYNPNSHRRVKVNICLGL